MDFTLQWNSHGTYCNYEELLQLLRNHDPVCICLQELILGSYFLLTPQGYVSFKSPIRGAARAFCSTIGFLGRRFLSVPRYMLWQYVFISIRSILFDPGMLIARDDLVELVCQLLEPFLLIGEFNMSPFFWVTQLLP